MDTGLIIVAGIAGVANIAATRERRSASWLERLRFTTTVRCSLRKQR
jgi:hypothetical protein